MEEENKYYLYRHIRLDKNEPFYIGIGTKYKKYHTFKREYSRAFQRRGRNVFWKRVVAKANYKVEILYESNDYNFLKTKEIEFIKLYGRRNTNTGSLVNLSDGGEGNVGMIPSKLARQKSSARLKEYNKIKWANIKEKILPGNSVEVLDLYTGIFYSTIIEAANSQSKYKISTMRTYIVENKKQNTNFLKLNKYEL